MRGQDTYKETITMSFPNMVAKIHFPDLTEQERKRRMLLIHKASANLLKSVEKGV